MKNYAQIEGNLGADAVTTELQNNRRVTRFSVAINKTWKRNGQKYTSTDWVKVAAWGKLTDFASKLKKGNPVLVQGELRSSKYKDANNVEHATFEIVAISIRKFDYMRDSASRDIETGDEEDDGTTEG